MAGIEYREEATRVPGLWVKVPKEAPDPKISPTDERVLLAMARLGWFIYLARRRKAKASARDTKLTGLVKEHAIWSRVSGLRRVTSRGVDMLIVPVVPRIVADNDALMAFLGAKHEGVVTGIDVSAEVLADPASLAELMAAMKKAGLAYRLQIDGKKFDALTAKSVEDGGLGPAPAGIFGSGAASRRLNVDPA